MANIIIPGLGESVTEAVLLRWLKKNGEAVKADEPVCELETDKANVELPSPAAGVLVQSATEGSTVKIGESIGQISESGQAQTASVVPTTPSKAKEPVENKTEEAFLSPSVRKALKEHPVDVSTLEGTGPRGRITKEDVLQKSQKPAPEAKKVVPPMPPVTPTSSPSKPVSMSSVERVPMTKIRKKIAERLVQVKQQTAMLTTFNEIDMSAVLELKDRYKARFQEAHGVSLGLMSFFARATILALREFPILNAFIDGDDIVYNQAVHLGIAVSTERGLVVPVLKNAEKLSFAKVESEIKRTAGAAREGKLSLDELSGGTFTITNGGVFGSLLSTPILNPPQSGILGMHTIQKRVKVIDDKIEIRPMMYVALSYDHRLVDGRDSVSFLVKVKEGLEDPARLMLEI